MTISSRPERRETTTLDADSALGDLVRLLSQALNRRLVADLAEAGFTDVRSAHLVVFKLLTPAGARLTELAAGAQMTKQSIGALVDDLVGWGYLERAADPSDARARIIRLTARGAALAAVTQASIRDFEAERERMVGRDRMRQFRQVLAELANNE